MGGRGSDVSKALPTAVYDTETCEWKEIPSINRFRHASWGVGPLLFAFGGFDHRSPSAPTNHLQMMDVEKEAMVSAVERPPSSTGSIGEQPVQPKAPGTMDLLPQGTRPSVDGVPRPATPPRQPKQAQSFMPVALKPPGSDTNDIRISPQVIVSLEKDFTHLVRKVNIEQLEEEGRKMSAAAQLAGVATDRANSNGVHTYVIDNLCQPTTWQPDPDPNRFLLHAAEVATLCDQVLALLKGEEMVLRLRAPIKVYGDIHGQFVDLMRLFARYKAPTDQDGGDIESMDYLFLGDYVDRGSFSLEVVVLLFALKIKYPRQIHLIRGNHEDPTINAIYGFRDECRRRLHEEPDDPDSCWNRFNTCFEWLPCAAIIEDRILCIHGGIGGSVNFISELGELQRPMKVAQIPQTDLEQRVTDLLWSDPSDSDVIKGVTMNETRDPDGTGRIVKFGPDRVEEFLEKNPPLSMIIRAHECIMDGFERFANGRLLTLFSATDYCGHHKNAGALLFVRRDLTIVPKLIYPVERSMNTWDTNGVNQRPPTPPRPVPRGRRSDAIGGENDW